MIGCVLSSSVAVALENDLIAHWLHHYNAFHLTVNRNDRQHLNRAE